MIELYNTLLFEPIYNLLVFLYDFLPGNDIGFAIIVLTLLIRGVFYPLQKKSIISQKALQDLQPKLEDLKKKYKNNKEEMAQKVMALYKEHKINPASSCLPLLIQLPFLIAIYQVFRTGFDPKNFELLYAFVPNPGVIDPMSFGLDLSQPQWILAVLAAIAQFWQAKMLQAKKPPVKSEGAKDEAMATIMQKQMVYVLPIITLWIGLRFPGGLTLYWFLTTLLTALQQLWIIKQQDKDKDKPEVVNA